MDISVWALVAPFIAAGLGAALTVWTQRHRELTAAWLSGKRDMDAARQREYSNLLRSADELAQANEFRTWRPGWNQLDENREPNADDEAAFAASSRLNQAQSQLLLIAPVDTYLAAQAYVGKVLDIADSGQWFLPEDHPDRLERGRLRKTFLDHARRDLNVAPLDGQPALTRRERLMTPWPVLRRPATRRAAGPKLGRGSESTTTRPDPDPSTS